jgi:hypothetical protein
MLTKEEFKEIHARYLSSGLSVHDFCRNEGICDAKFYYWQKKLVKAQPKGFVPLVIDKSKDQVKPSGVFNAPVEGVCCEIYYPCGTALKLTGSVDYELLRSLVLLNR